MRALRSIAALLAVGAPCARAIHAEPAEAIAVPQKPAASAAMETPAAKAIRMLRGHDPLQIAWAAAYVRDHPDDATTDALATLAEDSEPADFRDPDPKIKAQGLALLAVLDALIQTHTPISAGAVAALDGVFPVQAVILASRLPVSERSNLLMGWFERDAEPVTPGFAADDTVTVTPSLQTQAAGLLLAHEPPPGFAAGIVRAAQEDLRVVLTAGERPPVFGQGRSCDWAPPDAAEKGWPQLFTYAVRHFEPSSDTGGLIAEGGGSRLYFVRVETPDGVAREGGCPPQIGMNAFRHTLIAEMLGMDARAMRRTYWLPRRTVFLSWQTAEQFTQQIQNIVKDTETRMNASVQALAAKNALSPEQAAQVRPKLVLTIHDNRGPEQPPLPELVFTDARTVALVVAAFPPEQ